MEHRTKRNHPLYDLVCEYEAMANRGAISYLEERSFFDLIRYYEDKSDVEKAIEVTEHALTQYSYCVDFYLTAARLFGLNDNFDTATIFLEKAEIIAPNDVEVQLLKVKLLSGTGKNQEALDNVSIYKKLVTGMDKVEIYLAEASIHEAMKDFGRMYKSLSKALRLDPDNQVALEKIWMSVELSKKFKKSIQLHEWVLDQDAFNHLAWFNLGHALAGIGEYFKAISAMEYSYIVEPEFEHGYLDCADLCCQVRDYTRALRIYLEIAERFGMHEELMVQIAECHIELGEFAKAKKHLIQALKQDPYNDEVYYFLGQCFLNEGRIENAITSLQKAIEIEDRREEYYAELASAYVSNEEFGKADFFFRKSTEIGPEQEIYWIQHAAFLVSKERSDKALVVMEEADYHAVGSKLIFCRAACLFAADLRKEGLRCLESALTESIEDVDVLFDVYPVLRQDEKVCAMIHYYKGETAFSV